MSFPVWIPQFRPKTPRPIRTEPPEDCDSQCKGQEPPFQCCGGCPAQCYCRLEREADARASREEFYEAGMDDDGMYGDDTE